MRGFSQSSPGEVDAGELSVIVEAGLQFDYLVVRDVQELASIGRAEKASRVYLAVVDFEDAFYSLGLAKEEWPFLRALASPALRVAPSWYQSSGAAHLRCLACPVKVA